MPEIAALLKALVELDETRADRVITEQIYVAGSASISDRLIEPVLDRVGAMWERGELSLAQVYMASRLCERLVDTHFPMATAEGPDDAQLAIASFQDEHTLGKRIVTSLLRCAGYRVRDYGQGVGVRDLVARVRQDRIGVLLLSVLMLRSALGVRDLMAALRAEGLATRVVVGGAPFRLDPKLGPEVGADGWGTTASDAVRIVGEMVGGGPA